MNRRQWWAAAFLLAVGCDMSAAPFGLGTYLPNGPYDAEHQPGVKDRVSLVSFSGPGACADLERHLEDRAVLQMRVSLAESERYAFQTWAAARQAPSSTSPYQGGEADAGVAAAAGGGGGGSGSSGQPSAYTTTNTQVKGVDEPDFVKNDGTRIFVLSGQTLYATTSWPAAALARVSSLKIEGQPREMFLEGDRLVVFSEVYDASLGWPSWCSSPNYGDYCRRAYTNITKATFVDVADLANLRVTQTHIVPGSYQTARRVGSAVRLVVSAEFAFPPGVDTWLPYQDITSALSKRELAAQFEAMGTRNEAVIRNRSLSDWIWPIRSSAAGADVVQPLDCTKVGAPDVSSELGLASVVTLNLDEPSSISSTSLLARVDEVYASAGALYLAQRHWWWSSYPYPQPSATYLHKFDLSRPASVAWVGSGRVDGVPVDQFSMDEHDGFLRLATTVDSPSANGWSTHTSNFVTVLSEKSGALVTAGRSASIGDGERIKSARFIGTKGYVVTFRQTDPLFTFDLSDPAHPTQVGELQVPGYSSYIHPLDDNHLLTIGTADSAEGMGVQLAIYDVSDFARPRQAFQQLVGQTWGWSEAQWDHKAFNYFPERHLLAIPFFDWTYDGSWNSYVSDLRVFRVDSEAGFASLGSVDMRDVLVRQQSDFYACWGWWWLPMVRRSVMADDFVYAISSGGIRVANVANLAQPVATITFDYDSP